MGTCLDTLDCLPSAAAAYIAASTVSFCAGAAASVNITTDKALGVGVLGLLDLMDLCLQRRVLLKRNEQHGLPS